MSTTPENWEHELATEGAPPADPAAELRWRFSVFLSRSGRDGLLTEDEVKELKRRFQAGEVGAADVPLPLREAIPEPVTAGQVFQRVKELGEQTLNASRTARAAERDQLQTAFENRVMRMATEVESIPEWQQGFQVALSEYVLDEALLGLGRAATSTLTAEQLNNLTDVIQEQAAYLSRFADQRAAYAFRDELMSSQYIAARSALYSGRGRALWFQADEEVDGSPDTVVWYDAIGDAQTCQPCAEAEQGSPYLPAEGPMPGEVCDGHGYCRCVRRMERDAEVAAALRGEDPATT